MQESEGKQVAAPSAAALASSIVVDEQSRRERDAQANEADDYIATPQASMKLRDGLRTGGFSVAMVLLLFTVFEEFDRVAMQVLGPDIQETLGVSDTVLLGLQSFGGVVLVLATLPFAWLADRRRRVRVMSAASALWLAFVAITGSVVNTFQMGLARAGSGFGASA
jgi:hypothetical protein